MLAITDARFIDGLVREAIAAKKLPSDFTVPAAWRANTPETVQRALSPHADKLPAYPFGTELTGIEREIAPALAYLSTQMAAPAKRAAFILGALFAGPGTAARPAFQPHLERLSLDAPASWKDRLTQRLVLKALSKTR
jgi:hypothetical protein